ncbi:hypothetical protein B0H14DRAFT_2561994 [Mycena olivaceomarginata]|nr:hypothetical protein B0H14DRAFT_2561994 [Mycena olivaceomarginata]
MPLHEKIIVEDGDGDMDIASSDNGEPKAKESQGMVPCMPKAGKFDIDWWIHHVFPISCWIVDSPRWKTDAKPVPYGNWFISASGFLVGVEDRTVSGSVHKQRFIIDVDNVIYLGAPPTTAPATPVRGTGSEDGTKK